MNVADNMTLWIVGLVITGLIVCAIFLQCTPEARERRRCRRNHRRVVSRARRPIIMLSVRAPKT